MEGESIPYIDSVFMNIDNPSIPYNWRTRKQPIYRLLNKKQWLDNFFDSGELNLSCFSKFRNYPNEIQGDREEGDALIWLKDKKGDTHAIKYEAGLNSYILCCSLELNERIIKDFNAIGAIKINNPTFFSLEVMSKIENCTQGIEGICNYEDSRIFHNKSEKLKSLLDNKDFINDPLFINQFLIETGENELFLKKNLYEYQKEYRMLWFTTNKIEESIIIKCPDAIRFCERINF